MGVSRFGEKRRGEEGVTNLEILSADEKGLKHPRLPEKGEEGGTQKNRQRVH